jgi:hypothetical protein
LQTSTHAPQKLHEFRSIDTWAFSLVLVVGIDINPPEYAIIILLCQFSNDAHHYKWNLNLQKKAGINPGSDDNNKEMKSKIFFI